MKPSISVIIPALNEEENIKSTIENVLEAINDKFSSYELIIFDDYSQDNTGNIADALANENSNIKVIHNEKTMGFGYNYKKGLSLSKNEYIALIPGDNEIAKESIKDIFNMVGRADIVIPYTINYKIRPLHRQILSGMYTFVLNFLFGLKLKYFNGPVVHKKKIIDSISIDTNSFAFQSEALVKLIKSGHNFVEVGMRLKRRDYGRSQALQPKNIISVCKAVLRLFCYIYFKRK